MQRKMIIEYFEFHGFMEKRLSNHSCYVVIAGEEMLVQINDSSIAIGDYFFDLPKNEDELLSIIWKVHDYISRTAFNFSSSS